MKRFSQNGKTIIFYQKENDEKFSFLIENEPELTEKLLANIKTKRVKEMDIHYAVKGIFEKIVDILNEDFDEYEKSIKQLENSKNMENPIVALAETCQKMFGANIETSVIGKTGPDHCPTITVEIELPNGKKFTASGTNQKEAKQKAAKKALETL